MPLPPKSLIINHSKNQMKKITTSLYLALGFGLASLANAELLVYEGFSLDHYPVDTDLQNIPSSALGVMYWDAYKVPEPHAFVRTQEGSLSYEANGRRLVTSGGHALSQQTLRAYAVLGDTSTGQVKTYSDGTYYLSFLMQMTEPLFGYRGFELANGTRADSDLVFRIHNYSVEGRDGEWVLDLATPHNEVAGLGPVTTQTILIVARFDLRPGLDDVTVWVNPQDLSSEAANEPAYTVGFYNISFDRLAFSDFASQQQWLEGNIRWDEVRIATTWESALPWEPTEAQASAFDDSEDLGDGRFLSPWFGEYQDLGSRWWWHTEHGFIHMTIDLEDAVAFMDQEAGLLVTSPAYYPYLWSQQFNDWLYYFEGASMPDDPEGSRWFYSYALESAFRLPEE